MLKNRLTVGLVGIYLLVLSCGGYAEFENSATKDYTREKLQKFSKYMIQGKSLYVTHCSNCHQVDGTGLGKLYPPLNQSDYLMKHKAETVCLIKNGLKGEIVVNGIAYNQEMPANTQLSNLEIAEIATYVYNSWGNEVGLIPTKEISDHLNNCE